MRLALVVLVILVLLLNELRLWARMVRKEKEEQ